jgi:GTPase
MMNSCHLHSVLCLQLGANGEVLNDGLFRTHSCAEYIARSSKVVTLVDLAGHERYFKTTAYGLTGHLPDYACLIVGANAGVPLPPTLVRLGKNLL